MTATGPSLQAHGLELAVPRGWDAHIYRRADDGDGAVTNPVLHAATMPLPPGRGDFGSGAVDVMGGDDVLVVLFEYEPAACRTALFAHHGMPRPKPHEFHPLALQRTLPGQSGCQRFFHLRERAFCLYVVLGSHANRVRLVPRAHELLDALTVH